jgi:23S rRNA (uridine2552-2'-O)-methyltransferase
MDEHVEDEFVRRARQEGWRSRAVYKLQELDEKHGLIRPGMTVVDLGSAPGAWSQYAARKLDGRGRVVALDVLPMDGIGGVEFIEGDFREEEPLRRLEEVVGNEKVDLVLSDMAPNISGVAAVDQPRSVYLVELALDFARKHLVPEGAMVAKLFQGEGSEELIAEVKRSFGTVRVRKPRASRGRSREVYLVAENYRLM